MTRNKQIPTPVCRQAGTWNKIKIKLKRPIHILSIILFIILQSCSISKFIPEDETLYTGADLKIVENDSLKNSKKIKSELENIVTPEPNSKFLGMRLGLYYHYKAQKKNPGFINKWLNKKIGQEPVYMSEVNPQRVETLVLNRLDNNGFFYSKVTYQVKTIKKFTQVNYEAKITEPYVLNELKLDTIAAPLDKEITKILQETQLRTGTRFNLDLMKFERERIDNQLKQRGYYNFNPDFLIFEADTNRYKEKKFDLFLRLKKGTPKKSIIPYAIDAITVYPNYTIESDSISTLENSTLVDGINFIQKETFFKPELLEAYILLEKGQKYNAETARLTSNRLSALGSYKFVNLRFNEIDTIATDLEGSLSADLFLSPLTKRAIRAELQAVTKSNGFAGPGVELSYTNRNVFKGGERFSIAANFAYETQIANQNTGLSSTAFGIKTDLILPRLVPFSPKRFKYAVPSTKISLGADILNRSKLYSLTSFNSSFGYEWKANKYVFHQINPISITYVNLSNTTQEFEDILDTNPFLAGSFEQQFIAGLNYTFSYNELADERKNNPIYIGTGIDLAGNTLSLLSGGSKNVFGLEYAQYGKADVDFRHYYKMGEDQTIISRIYAGWGIPFGNSTTLPFVKQFFSGGPYSVRAFQIRSLGPGAFSSESSPNSNTFFDQSGNLKLEANLEYRFPIWSYFKGALFADAGNIWLTSEASLPEGTSAEARAFNQEFTEKGKFGSDWIKELGIGVGFGLRVDVQNFVIRFDLASPLQVPFLPEGERLRTPFFGGGDNNLVFNFAIGYPF